MTRPPRTVQVLAPRFAERLTEAVHRREIRTYADILALQAEERAARVAEDLARAQRVSSGATECAARKGQPPKRP